ncbi:hypothetical protein RI367_007893 [Sorochytrium milnesiophthora]
MVDLLVVGGTGFVGVHICRAAVRRGWTVASLSRRQHPTNFYTRYNYRPRWADKVDWLAGDVFDEAVLKQALPGRNAVVHSLGTLFAGQQYKDVVNAKTARQMLTGVRKLVLAPQHKDGDNGTMERINRDSVISLAKLYADEHTSAGSLHSTFVHMSASIPSQLVRAGVVNRAYLDTKRDAEHAVEEIAHAVQGFRAVSMRPGLIYSEQRPLTVPLAALAQLADSVLALGGGGIVRPIHVEDVAEAVLAAIENDQLRGPIDAECMAALASSSPSTSTKAAAVEAT